MSIKGSARCGAPTVLALLLAASATSAHGAQHFTNGRWYDGTAFVAREFYEVAGVLRDDYDEDDAQVVDLGGGYVVPGYGNAHTHGVGNGDFSAESRQFLGRGVFYVANPNSIGSLSAAARESAGAPETVDARFANGGLTSSGGHPIQIFERSTESRGMDGDAYWIVDDLEQLEDRWPEILAGNPDFLKVYLESSEHHALRRNDPAYYGKRGLDPVLVASIVAHAHDAGFRVAAHVTTRHDFRVAVEASVDEIAHLPLEQLDETDVQLAAMSGTVLVTTALSHRPSDAVEDLDVLHRDNLILLRDAGISIVLGTDSQATVIDELRKIASLDVFDRSELLRMLVHDTPRWIFPGRNIGTLAAGAEASFVVLSADPLEDLSALTQITAGFKAGHRLELQARPADGKRGIGQHLAHAVMSKGVDAAIGEYHRLRAEEPNSWDFSEGQLNALGYAMMQHGKLVEATGIFQLNCEQFPESANAWESLGESYAKRGETESAIEKYERAVELQPGLESAIAKLAELRGTP
jgi:imidazolonepropionase-like amidohydrolase